MSEKITCPQCQAEVDATESHCPKCDALLLTDNPLDDLDEMDKTMAQPGLVDDGSFLGDEDDGDDDGDDELRTVRMEGFSSADLAAAGLSFGGPGDELPDDMSYDQFLVQEDRTVVSGSGSYGQAGGAPFVGSGEFPQAGSPFGDMPPMQPPVQPPGGYVFIEGADSPSMTVRHEAPSMGRDEPLSTYSGPADISRGSGSSSPLKGVIGLGVAMIVVVAGFLVIQNFMPAQKPMPVKVVSVILELTTKPIGAEVTVNGQKIKQTTPASIQARIGDRVNIQIDKKDFETINFTWVARGNDLRTFQLKSTAKPKPAVDPAILALNKKAGSKAGAKAGAKGKPRKRRYRRRRSRIPPDHAALYVKTIPPGAKVRVQGRLQRGRTPLRIILQKGLEAKITVKKYGHYDSYFMWKANKNTHKTLRMYRKSWYNP